MSRFTSGFRCGELSGRGPGALPPYVVPLPSQPGNHGWTPVKYQLKMAGAAHPVTRRVMCQNRDRSNLPSFLPPLATRRHQSLEQASQHPTPRRGADYEQRRLAPLPAPTCVQPRAGSCVYVRRAERRGHLRSEDERSGSSLATEDMRPHDPRLGPRRCVAQRQESHPSHRNASPHRSCPTGVVP